MGRIMEDFALTERTGFSVVECGGSEIK